ncbi:MAG: DNA-directed RNA polymerase subunit beta', partial [Clostridia bacterium]|nr:DNA-directed RNA polymerase subunit beta' [Clostridia bacterium]
LLNRAPTLHRLSIQAFEPVLVEGRAIKLHPLVCKAFNADFDGDQMPIHVPLSAEAQAEARFLMLSANNLLKPVDGKAITVPSQDMVLGSFYLTIDRAGEPGEGKVFRDFNEAMMAYQNGDIGLHAPIKVRVFKERNGVMESKIIDATMGLLIFNQPIPQDLGYVDRSDPDKFFDLEITFVCGSKQLGQIIDRCIKIHGFETTAEMLDNIKAMGYKYSTKASISISIADMAIPPQKYTLVAEAEKKVDEIQDYYMQGVLSDEERYRSVIATWEKTTDEVVAALQANFNRYNPIKMMSDSGARGNVTQMRQLAGIRGLMFATSGKTMEIPIKSNFREGLNILEYFIAARGARKSLSDTALKTADSGYLTRRLVDVSQDVIIREVDCGATHGIVVSDIMDGNQKIESLSQRIHGRYVIGDVVDPATGEVIVPDNTMVTEEQAKAVEAAGIKEVHIRTVLQCKARHGVCSHCYGADLANSKTVNIGEAVGIIAAQSIGEPGTQLTMRTFHTGGVASANITQGLPRVEELFEARKPKKTSVVAEFAGTVEIRDVKKIHNIVITNAETGEQKEYPIPYGTTITVEDGEFVTAGQELTEGYKNPADILRINGIDAVYDYIILEVQKVYSSQNIGINDKHIEIITRQMTRKMHIVDPGSTDMLPGINVEKIELLDANEEIQKRIDAGERDLMLATAEPVLLGITKASLQCESFLSAASFQETTKVLTEAAIKGKVDHLMGLKENVLIGKLIPAGTGMPCYNNIEVEKINSTEDDEFYEKYGTISYEDDREDDEPLEGEDVDSEDYIDDDIDDDVISSSEMFDDEFSDEDDVFSDEDEEFPAEDEE